jgi:hypothetical protein
MNVFKSILFISLIVPALYGQKDSVAYGTLGFQLKEGFYLNFTDLKLNQPITKRQIVDNSNQDGLDYFTQLVKNYDTLVIQNKEGKNKKIAVDSIWGYCQNNQIYTRFENDFFKVPLFGNASTYLIFVKQTTPRSYNPWLYDPYFNNANPGFGINNNNNATTVVTIQMLLDMQTGSINEFSLAGLEAILARDAALFKDYSNLSKKKRKQKAIFYLRKYNMLHPIYFPKQ